MEGSGPAARGVETYTIVWHFERVLTRVFEKKKSCYQNGGNAGIT